MKNKFTKVAKTLGVEITSFRSERHDGNSQIYTLTINLSERELDYGYYIGEPDSSKDKMLVEFADDIKKLQSKLSTPTNHEQH